MQAIQKGLTLIEVMIILAIIGILVATAFPFLKKANSSNEMSIGPVQPLNTSDYRIECIDGYKFNSIDHKQIIDDQGRGVKCS